MATFKRLNADNRERNVVRIGKTPRRMGYRDPRPSLNQNGTYAVRLKNGQDANVEVVVDRNKGPQAKIAFMGNDVLVPILDVARSIKTNQDGTLVRV